MQKVKLKTLLFKVSIFLLTVFAGDIFFGSMLKKYYKSQECGEGHLTTFAIENANPQTLILGSSRAVNIFDPCVFKYELNTKTFNAGRVGQSIFYHYGVFTSMLKRHKPEIVILSFDRRDFSVDESDYDRLSELLPFYESHQELKPIFNLRGPFENLKTLSAIYPYNSLLLPIIRGHICSHHEVHFNGYKPLDKTTTSPPPKINYGVYATLDTVKINAYKALIADCKREGIELFITCPPYFTDAISQDSSLLIAKKIAKENGISFIDDSDNSFYTSRKEYFADFRHLNENGSMTFSKEVSKKIKDLLASRLKWEPSSF